MPGISLFQKERNPASVRSYPGRLFCTGHDRHTTGAAASSPTVPANSSYFMVQSEADARMALDGTDASATNGLILKADVVHEFHCDPNDISLIQVTAAAVVNFAFFGVGAEPS